MSTPARSRTRRRCSLGRPVALTARGRAQVRVDHVPPEARRLVRQMALLLLVILVAVGVRVATL